MLVKDTDYIVEKTYHLAPYLGPFGTWVIPQLPKYSKMHLPQPSQSGGGVYCNEILSLFWILSSIGLVEMYWNVLKDILG